MHDELIKNLRHDSASALQNCDFDFVLDWMLKAADAIEELQQIAKHYEECSKDYFKDVCYYLERMPRWIPVTERLPEENGSYLIVNAETVTKIVSEAYYDKRWGDSCWTDPVELYMTYRPTHWMPLPEPPESEDK